MSSANARLYWVDIAKGIAILLVIVGHTVSVGSPLRHYIFSFHMPLFFCLSGITFRVKPWKEVFLSSAKRLLLPYLLIVLIWQVPAILSSDAVLDWAFLGGFLMKNVFASGTIVEPFGFEAVGMTWFLVALFVSRIMLNFFMGVFDRRMTSLWIQGVVFSLVAFFGASCGGVWRIYLPFSFDVCFVAVFFMWCGHVAKKKGFLDATPRWSAVVVLVVLWVAFASFSTLELAARSYDNFLVAIGAALLGSYGICLLSMCVEELKKIKLLSWVRNFLVFCGRNTMCIFSVHAMDWWIPWETLPQLAGLPFSNGVASFFRAAYAVLFAALMKRV